jgi:hypothetical protein
MQCLDFESRLQSALDARQAPQSDAVLNSHAAECADCRQLLAAMLAVVEGAAAMSVACPASMTRQVLEQMRPGGRRVLPLRWAVPLAAAAALAGALPLWSWLGREHGSPENQMPATNRPGQLAQANPGSATAEPRGPQAEPRGPQAEPWSLVPELSDFRVQTDHDLDVGLNDFSNDVREGLAPVTRSTAGALESLWQALSPSRASPAEDNRS